jgi:hypothetical protein
VCVVIDVACVRCSIDDLCVCVCARAQRVLRRQVYDIVGAGAQSASVNTGPSFAVVVSLSVVA